MSRRTTWVSRMLSVLRKYPPCQVDEFWLGEFREVLRIPEGKYPPGTYCESSARNSVYIIPEELVPWLGAEGYLTEEEMLMLDVELLLEATE